MDLPKNDVTFGQNSIISRRKELWHVPHLPLIALGKKITFCSLPLMWPKTTYQVVEPLGPGWMMN